MFVRPIKQFESQRYIKQQKVFYYYLRNSFKKHDQVLRNSCIQNLCNSFIEHKILTFFTVADCDIMGRIITQTRGQAFNQSGNLFTQYLAELFKLSVKLLVFP